MGWYLADLDWLVRVLTISSGASVCDQPRIA